MLQERPQTTQGRNVDLVGLLGRRAKTTVSVSSMAGSLLVPVPQAEEIDAAVGEALTNVERHAGDGAQAWILVEDEGDSIVVSVRDNGKGMSEAIVAQAAAGGHRGVIESIEGRIRALGGVATWRSRPGEGVEWEMRVPSVAGRSGVRQQGRSTEKKG